MTMSMEHHLNSPNGRETGKPDFEAPLMTGSRKQAVSPLLAAEGLSPESITSVPNPFAFDQPTGEVAMPNTVSDSSMNWGSSSPVPPQQASNVPHSSPTGNPVMFAASGINVPGAQASASVLQSSPVRAAAAPKAKKAASPQKKEGASSPTNNRRQKRLERNRESARLSRRRRKQYLEVLEERVQQLSLEMDKGRREHVAAAMPTLQEQRLHALQNLDLASLETTLSRSSDELRVAATFQSQQLQSLVFPPQTKFLLWLSLQTDTYFRGGRAASERLSAARIGERMLSSGNDRVPPAQGMWPLLCNDVGLSYDQEERIRCAQRVLVQTPETWLDRHTGTASGLAMQSAHDCMQSVSNSVEGRELSIMGILTEEQRIKFLQWAANNKQNIAGLKRGEVQQDSFTVSANNHQAANLYIINHRLQRALNRLATPPALVVGSSVKRLSRRPSFESLGSQGTASDRKDEARGLTREGSFASSGSLKRSASELEMDGDKPQGQSVSPEDAEVAAQPTINAALGFVKGIMPLRAQPQPEPVSSFTLPPKPAPVLSHSSVPSHPYQQIHQQQQPVQQQAMVPQPVVSAPAEFQPPAQQQPVPSFLPQPLNAVPEEEGFLGHSGSDPADDFLFELAEEDWAIGEGFEMDTT